MRPLFTILIGFAGGAVGFRLALFTYGLVRRNKPGETKPVRNHRKIHRPIRVTRIAGACSAPRFHSFDRKHSTLARASPLRIVGPSKMKRRAIIIAAIIIGLIASPWILAIAWIAGGSVYGRIDQWRYRPTTEFRAPDWKSPNQKYRYAVLDYVATQVVVPGMTADEVGRLLGPPDSRTAKNEWQYETKRPGWRVIDFSGGGLLIEFDARHRVTKVSKNFWLD